jgi:small subunit ribosomal protein S1
MATEQTEQRIAGDGVWITGPDGDLIPDYESTFPTINEGEVVHGTVVRVDKDEVLVDIGYKSEGVIPVAELSIRRSVNPADEVSVGDEIDALVMTKEDAEGRLILSKKRARFELAWKAIEGAAESGEPVTGRVIEVVKGGLILDLGVRGFLPASLVDIRRVQDLDEFMGQELRCKVFSRTSARRCARRSSIGSIPATSSKGRSRTSSTSVRSSTSTGWTASSTSPSSRGRT